MIFVVLKCAFESNADNSGANPCLALEDFNDCFPFLAKLRLRWIFDFARKNEKKFTLYLLTTYTATIIKYNIRSQIRRNLHTLTCNYQQLQLK